MLARRREFLKTVTAAAAVRRAVAAAPSARPNVVIILTDDQGYGDLSCHGNPVLQTPNMDRIHAQGVRFTDFHSAPMCTPTRGQLMTGQDALRNGATSVTAGRAIVRKGIPTMADVFAANGYRTGVFGKWHMGDNYPYRPMERGFQEAKYHLGFGMSSAPEFDNDYFGGRYHDKGVVKRFAGYCTDFWFDQAMNWMGSGGRGNQPFLCYLPTNTPHGPAWVDPKYSSRYQKPGQPAPFFGMLANLDENIGRLEKFLQDKGLRDNTILVFLTDNGATAGFNLFNAGMRGRKTMYYEGGHRVPCFVRWPSGNLGPPRDVDTPAQMQDLLPTLVDLCGLKKPESARFDGRSLAGPLRRQGAVGDRMLVVQYGQIPKKWEACVIWNKWRLVNGEELYDLKSDPAQKSEVGKTHGDVLRKMRDYYEGWWAGVENRITDFAPISIGADQANPVRLTCSDWQDVYCDNPRNVSDADGGAQGGPWNVLVERDGEYEFTLSRWPAELGIPLNAGREPQQMTFGSLPPGKAVPIAGAKLTIAGQSLAGKTGPKDVTVTFRAKLQGGQRTKLHAWFQDASGADVCGAFYAVVKRV
jgi:arylsulfatase A-like enzyme